MSVPTKTIDAMLGRSSQQIQVALLPFPDLNDLPVFKAQAFDHCMNVVNMHRTKFEFAELSSFINRQVPNGNGTALSQATELGNTLHDAFFEASNLTGTGFFDANQRLITDDELVKLPHHRPKNIALASFEATVDPSLYFPAGAVVGPIRPISVTFKLALPQTTVNTSTGTAGRSNASTGSPARRRTVADITLARSGAPRGVGEAGGSDTINEYAAVVIALLSPVQISRLTTRSAISSGLASPRFTLRPAADSTDTLTTYTGDYTFLDNQEHFDQTFFSRTFHTDGSSKATIKRISDFISDCQYSVFTQLLRVDYVGTSKLVDNAHVRTLTQQLCKLKMTTKDGKTHEITSTEELFDSFLRIATLLPNEAKTWGICIAHVYLAALTEDCRSNMEDQLDFELPNPADLVTKATQLSALRDMRIAASDAQRRLDKTFKQHQQFMISFNKSNKKAGTFSSAIGTTPATTPNDATTPIPTAPTTKAAAVVLLSPAEGVIRQHSTQSPIQQPVPPVLTTTTPQGIFPVNPTTGFQSKYTLDFQGCLGCGDLSHRNFRECPKREDKEVAKEFFQELHAHKPRIRLAAEQRKAERRAAAQPQPIHTTVPLGHAQQFVASATSQYQPAPSCQPSPTQPLYSYGPPSGQLYHQPYQPWYNHSAMPPWTVIQPLPLPPLPDTTQPPPQQPPTQQQPDMNDPSKKPRYYVITARSCSAVSGSPLPPMPIAIDNGFPNLTIDLGQTHDQFSLSGLFDTCGSLNTGYLPFHAWIASQHPDAIAEFRYFNSSAPFEPVKLEGAVTEKQGGASTQHGLLTAIVRYRTPYVDQSGSPITLSFALGNDVSTNTIFGLPTISALEFVIDMRTLSAHSQRLDRTFTLTKAAGSLGVPAGTSFDPDVHRRVHDAATSISHNYQQDRATADTSHLDTQQPTMVGQDDHSHGYLRRSLVPSLT